MSHFDDETQVSPLDPAPGGPQGDDGRRWQGQVSAAWNIGTNPNGGYLLALAGAALQQATPGQPDPLSITAHYLRPGLGDQPAELQVDLMRRGRTLSTARARLLQDGQPRLELLAAMGTLGPLGGAGAPQLTLPLPDLPPPDDCPGRSAPAQGVSLSILDRLDIRLHPQHARAGEAGEARVSGWIRFRDGRDADPLACLLMADAFPPAVFGLLGQVGWVPTVELTVHLRARPAPGWLRAQFVAQDLADGRMIEDGALWDCTGRLVAQSRQLALVRLPDSV